MESFNHPTDTLLPGMNFQKNLSLHSWRDENDPGVGNFIFEKVQNGGPKEYIVKNQSILYWKSGRLERELLLKLLLEGENQFPSPFYDEFSRIRLVMNYSGEIMLLKLIEKVEWFKLWWNPRDVCDIYEYCGNFSTCNTKNWKQCSCLPGFSPRLTLPDNEYFGERFPGCVRSSDIESSKKPSIPQLWKILTITGVVTILIFITIVFVYVKRNKIFHKRDGISIPIQENKYGSDTHGRALIELGNLEDHGSKNINGVIHYTFSSIVEATNDFSNKLGEGGYGPIYKGRFSGGQEIAVKRLSRDSKQGFQEFENEVVLISKLQHRNLVALKGCCLNGEETILVYEYMPNKSLNTLLFGQTHAVFLEWNVRYNIILGISRGLMYLHHDSRLKVIHRDIKTSNILLDEDMTPKISDFGLAKLYEGNDPNSKTKNVVGTVGYMSPEYAGDGIFSIKSDVFSYGIIILEILSGKQNTSIIQYEENCTSLLSYAWRLWKRNMLMDLMDPALKETCNEAQFIKCAHIAMLCVQDDPNDRPTTFNIVTLFNGETASMPTPKESRIFRTHDQSGATSSREPEITLESENQMKKFEDYFRTLQENNSSSGNNSST